MRLRRILAGALFVVACISIPIAVVEFVGQKFVIRGGRQYFFRDVDHRMKPNARPGINADGLRSDREADAFREEDTNIIFLGDSFVYGLRLTGEESIPSLVEAMARDTHPGQRINVANFGWISASPLLSLRLLRDIGARYHPDTIILGLDMTDFHDDLKYARLLDRTGIFRGLSVAPISIWMVRKLLASSDHLDGLHTGVFGYPGPRFFAMTRPLGSSRPWLEATRRNLDAIHSVAERDLGARFVTFVFPRSFQYSDREHPESWELDEVESLGPHVFEPFAFFDEVRDQLPFPVISLLPDFQSTDVFPTCFHDDSHWNADGAAIAARAIVAHCSDLDCFVERGERRPAAAPTPRTSSAE